MVSGGVTRLKMSSWGAMLTEDDALEPLVPTGLLTQNLNCTAPRKKEGLEVVHPRRGKLEVMETRGCPQLSRKFALDLIYGIEEKNRGVKQEPGKCEEEVKWTRKLIEKRKGVIEAATMDQEKIDS